MKIVIIGAVAAGATCATNLRKLSDENEIILLEKGRDTSFLHGRRQGRFDSKKTRRI
ncbi:MAG: hypothetical protein E6706_06970 [Anaerococcus hydrogenalis]|nr:hypothetical protein [Anaerococcus hydrogenalis]